MTNDAILASIDEQIEKLQRARALLMGDVIGAVKKSPGRPKKAPTSTAAPKKRTMSAEARARIAAAQKKRWAAARKAAK